MRLLPMIGPAAALAITACQPASQSVTVTMVRGDSDLLAARSLAPGDVESLAVTVDWIEFVPADADADTDEDDDGSWLSLDVDFDLDLAALPTDPADGVVLGTGALETGDYDHVRLFVSDATAVFAEEVQLGQAITYDAGVEYDVTIPSGDQTGIKSDTGFTVDGGDVLLVFDEDATYANMTVTGQGRVMLAPVIHVVGDGE